MAISKIVIIHGTFGDPNENWIPYLRNNLSALGLDVIALQFPIGDSQNLKNWTKYFEENVGTLNQDMALVGHSIAPGFILALLQNSQTPVGAIFLVSAFLHDLGIDQFDKVNNSFTHFDFDFEKIKSNFEYGHSFHGVDDPYVPMWMGQEVALKLGIELTPIENGGHLNIDAGFKEFPELLNKIKETV